MQTHYRPGTIVSARGREWIVLPSRESDVLRLRPLTTAQGEEVGLFLPLEGERVRFARFEDPKPVAGGDATGIMTLFDAGRLSLRAGAGPFRSLGHISVVLRPYQFVPLIMSLRQFPVRLLIADDVGVGKTIEAAMIARELLDRGLARRLAVLCPAHLCDQWEQALREKFAISAALVQPSQMRRLERALPRPDISVYQHHPHFVASIDFIKSASQRDRFLAAAPDLVIVDEAHASARPRGTAAGVEHQRYELLHDLAGNPDRHILLVTATPHSGIEESFRSLLGLLDPAFDRDPAEPLDRGALVPYLVQRRRRDVEKWLGSETPFPDRRAGEALYDLSRDYQRLFSDVLDYCRESLDDARGLRVAQQRVRHWAAIAILRSVLSSPDAAAMVLGNRAAKLGDELDANDDTTAVDETYRPQVLDLFGEDEAADYAPTGPVDQAERIGIDYDRRRLKQLGDRARALAGAKQDLKLARLIETVRDLVKAGCRPIVFCRFIPTAHYIADHLGKHLGREFAGLHVEAVTGDIGDDQRKEKIADLALSDRRILVATDCLSEGIDLQEQFDAVIHYDLPWNPNRLEQREGRVDRFGQKAREVRTVLLYGINNQVDQVVLEVLIRKAVAIRKSLGIAVPVPVDPEQVMETVVDNVLLARVPRERQLELALSTPDVSRLHQAWDEAAEREKRDRGFFSQRGIRPDEVAREIDATDSVLGDPDTVRRFIGDALQRFGGRLTPAREPWVFNLEPGELKPLRLALGSQTPVRVAFATVREPVPVLGRTHPAVAALCNAVLNRAFGVEPDTLFARTGAMRTDSLRRRTVLVLVRLRYTLEEQAAGSESGAGEEFAEEVILAAFERREGSLTWLEPIETAGMEIAEAARPVSNINPEEKRDQIAWALEFLTTTPDWHAPIVKQRVAALEAAHARLRKLTKAPRLKVSPHEPPDILGCFVLLPAGGAA
ncbi:MAG: DEAD/DEAH box helicase family protein [Alphaproteobacteria bacterium]|nr:DEAD/DEAH box helicase family protein [Alphaproteobacteria bacterium]